MAKLHCDINVREDSRVVVSASERRRERQSVVVSLEQLHEPSHLSWGRRGTFVRSHSEELDGVLYSIPSPAGSVGGKLLSGRVQSDSSENRYKSDPTW